MGRVGEDYWYSNTGGLQDAGPVEARRVPAHDSGLSRIYGEAELRFPVDVLQSSGQVKVSVPREFRSHDDGRLMSSNVTQSVKHPLPYFSDVQKTCLVLMRVHFPHLSLKPFHDQPFQELFGPARSGHRTLANHPRVGEASVRKGLEKIVEESKALR